MTNIEKLLELNIAQLADTHAADLAKGHPVAKTAHFCASNARDRFKSLFGTAL